jgi:ABC-type multidrug transport system ATPase subunit
MPNISSEPEDGSTEADAVLEASGLEKTYQSRLPFVGRSVEVLTGTDITLTKGEIVGIVGGNGSGKSTLMKILVGALQADAGYVTRNGTIGWCPQETLLYDRLTVAETFDLFGEAYDFPDDRVVERRDELAELLDFEQFLDYRVDHLSGGNRQKVNLAIALLHEPDLLLLDEPYTGFDWETYLAFWDLADTLVEEGTTIAIISHLISERERFDRILELEAGTLTEQSTAPQQPRSSAHDTQAADGEAVEQED